MSLDITVTKEQAQVLCKACEILSHIHRGDFGDIAVIPHLEEELDRNSLREGLESLGPLATGMAHGRFYDLDSKHIHKEARTAHDLYLTIQSLIQISS